MGTRAWRNQKRKGSFYQVHRDWADSVAFRDLTPIARCLLHEFLLINNPGLNGSLNISVRRAGQLIGCSKTTAAKAFAELTEHGFLELTEHSSWIDGKARSYRLTMMQVGNRKPTDEWRDWNFDKCLSPTKKSRSVINDKASSRRDKEARNRAREIDETFWDYRGKLQKADYLSERSVWKYTYNIPRDWGN